MVAGEQSLSVYHVRFDCKVLSNSIPKTVKEDDHDAGARNPMLYDPLTENNVKTTKLMQYVATFVGQLLFFSMIFF